ncbi:MAG: glycosyltransferase, partial [Bdellovibrionales bacterium]|nr:glycosyltransferase [Bdellovibrionales bacterium]
VGILTTWNQHCGLATYARYLVSEFPSGSYVILGEQVQPIRQDEPYVTRCWSKEKGDFEKLAAEIEIQDIGLLHLNCHYRWFPQPEFSKFLNRLKASGIRVVTHVHTTFSLDVQFQALIAASDLVITHTPENALEVIANGGRHEQISVIPHGVNVCDELPSKSDLRSRLGLPQEKKLIMAFGFLQPHKGMEGVFEAVMHLKARGVPAAGYIVGKPSDTDPNSGMYVEALQTLRREYGLEKDVEFITDFIPDEAIGEYLAASDVVLMNYRSQHFEASGACSLAIGAGALVATSIAPPFMPFSDSVWHITAGFPVAQSIEVLVNNSDLANRIRQNAKEYAAKNSWKVIAGKVAAEYRKIGFHLAQIEACEQSKVASPSLERKSMKVLMQNRPTTFTHRGGDTVLLEKTKEALEKRGVSVTVDVEGREDPSDYEVVHLFNFATPDYTRALAQRAKESGTPYVVSTLYEDIPGFHNQSRFWADMLVLYVEHGQDKSWFEKHRSELQKIEGCQPFDNTWTAENAGGLLANGSREAEVLKRDYP